MAPSPGFRTRPPAAPGPLVGRSEELARIAEAPEGLVTIKGPGGIGKTRIAIEAATCLSEGFLFCDLTFAKTEEDVWRALASAMGTELTSPAAILAELGRAVVVLDNVESVTVPGRSVVQRVLRDAPEARLLAASREALDIPGERVVELRPLDVASDGVTLFLQHASRRDPPLRRTPENEASLLALVRAVDGIPLAIELAARRASVLGVEAVLEHISSRGIGILSRPGSDRHASLERTLEESFLGLADAERAAFQDAAVFRGGFTLEAARAVLEGDAPELLHALCDKSLLWLEEPGGRFRMHQVIRDFALERGAERARAAAERHARYFIDWIDRVRSPAGVIPSRAQRDRVLADVENVRAAAEHALEAEDIEGCVCALAALAPTLRIYGESSWWSALRDRTRPFDARLSPALLSRALLVETLMVSLRGRRDEAEARAARLAESAVDPDVRLAAAILEVQLLLDRGDAEAAARARARKMAPAHDALEAEWALVRVQTLDPSRPETRTALEEATAAAERTGDATLVAATARVAAALELAHGDVPAARKAFEREAAVAGAAALHPVLAQNALRLGCCDLLEASLEAATERFAEAEARMRALELHGRVPRAKILSGLAWIERGDPARGLALLEEAATAASDLHIDTDVAIASVGRAVALHLLGRGPMPAVPAPTQPWASPALDLERALHAVVRRTFAAGAPLRIETDAEVTWFSVGKERVPLEGRPSLRKILCALLDARGAAVESAVLIAAGWPGERIREDAARNRLRVAIATLRKLGLEAIETEESTYRLRAVVIRR